MVAATPITLGIIRRNYCGIPQRPSTATPEMIDIAEKVVRLYAQIHHEQKNSVKADEVWITDAVNETLNHFVDFAERHIKAPQDPLQKLLSVFQSRTLQPEEQALIQQWIHKCGYETTLIEGSAKLTVA